MESIEAHATRSSSASSGSADEAPRNIYVIQIAPEWISSLGPAYDESIDLLYVGQTKEAIGKRFRQHRRGYSPKRNPGEAAAKVFRDIYAARLESGEQGTLLKGEDAWIRWDLMADIPEVNGKDAAEKLEAETANSLRAQGFQVEGPGKPRKKPRKRR